MMLKRLFGSFTQKNAPRRWCSTPGTRLYAVGDVHGRADLLEELLARIDTDHATRPPSRKCVIFLGDLIDRGSASRSVIERVLCLTSSSPDYICLAGNHEQLLLKVWDGERGAVPMFHRAGGRATMLSYGVCPETYDLWNFDELQRGVRHYIPQEHIDFIRHLPLSYRDGDYLFVHAGVRPGVALDAQRAEDLCWIREDFTSSDVDHQVMVIHGHSIQSDVVVRHNRIGIDTGAYKSGCLTAIAIESDIYNFLSTASKEGTPGS